MTVNYLNVNELLENLVMQQQHIERYVGLKQVVDAVCHQHKIISEITSKNQREMKVLLLGQHNAEENGLYYIDALGLWKPLVATLEIGNIVACKKTKIANQYDYYKLHKLIDNKQIWQHFNLSDLRP